MLIGCVAFSCILRRKRLREATELSRGHAGPASWPWAHRSRVPLCLPWTWTAVRSQNCTKRETAATPLSTWGTPHSSCVALCRGHSGEAFPHCPQSCCGHRGFWWLCHQWFSFLLVAIVWSWSSAVGVGDSVHILCAHIFARPPRALRCHVRSLIVLGVAVCRIRLGRWMKWERDLAWGPISPFTHYQTLVQCLLCTGWQSPWGI